MKNRTFLLILSMVLCLCSCKKEAKNSGEDKPAITQTEEIEALQTLPKTKAFYTNLLEDFFLQHYGDCFKGSNYVENTVSVIKLEFADEKMEGESDSETDPTAASTTSKQSTSDGKNEVEVVGTHTYVGTGGYQVTGQKFKAIISIAEEGFNIDVFRESTQILTSKSFWEKGTGNMVFVQ
ncbi:MAG: hypothetical protein J6Y97_07560 [Prevotella sp.]|nr:hypothetical protein [Prevotella sp.]MBP5507408.1 hypothetical protein [Prevotella sp.]